MSSNLELWDAVSRTDPAATKGFSRGGGFKGTAISPMYLIHKATERWGPMGIDWGVRIIQDRLLEGAPLLDGNGSVIGRESVHMVQIELWFPSGRAGEHGVIPAFGQTTFAGKYKSGPFTDEEAPKKSLTDALTKALSWLGFAADVHMGLFDDNKYVADRRNEEEQAKRKADPANKVAQEAAYKNGMSLLGPAADQGTEKLKAAWQALPKDLREACKDVLPQLKEHAAKMDAEKGVKNGTV